MINQMRESKQTKILDAYVERRKRLTKQVKAENPSYTDTQIEERLEQLGV